MPSRDRIPNDSHELVRLFRNYVEKAGGVERNDPIHYESIRTDAHCASFQFFEDTALLQLAYCEDDSQFVLGVFELDEDGDTAAEAYYLLGVDHMDDLTRDVLSTACRRAEIDGFVLG